MMSKKLGHDTNARDGVVMYFWLAGDRIRTPGSEYDPTIHTPASILLNWSWRPLLGDSHGAGAFTFRLISREIDLPVCLREAAAIQLRVPA